MRPKGKYRAKGIAGSGELTTSSKKGTEQIEVELEFLDEQYAGQTIRWIGFCTDATVDRTMESLRLLGWEGDDISDLRGIDANEVEIVIDHENDLEGNPRERVKWINKLGGFRVGAPMDDTKKKAFAARMKGAAIKSRQNGAGGSQNGGATDFPFGNNAKDNVGF